MNVIAKALMSLIVTAAVANGAMAAGPADVDPGDKRSADTFLQDIYAHYRENGEGIPTSDARVYSRALRTLMHADATAAGEGNVGLLDYDPLCDCQDFDIKTATFVYTPAGKDRLDAAVSFHNLDADESLHLLLVRAPDGWRIDDVISKAAGGSLRIVLQNELKKPAH